MGGGRVNSATAGSGILVRTQVSCPREDVDILKQCLTPRAANGGLVNARSSTVSSSPPGPDQREAAGSHAHIATSINRRRVLQRFASFVPTPSFSK